MIRLAKLTDYGIALMSHMARADLAVREASAAQATASARELAEATQLPLPTVSKLLKVLTASGMLASQRGVHGGYALTQDPALTSVADVIVALEGPVSLTECDTNHSTCAIEQTCRLKSHWHKINLTVRHALEQLTLADMARDALPDAALPRRSRRTLPLLNLADSLNPALACAAKESL
jgi:FeS assembly SUF system regulator